MAEHLVDQALAGLVDPARLAAWLDDRLPGAREPLGVERITSGASNEVFVLRRADAEWVLRRPARGAAPSETMAREFRVLTALEGTPVPHPTPLALCEDAEVLGAPFYVMDRIDGFTPRIPLPPPFDGDATACHDMGIALVDVLGDLACVDWRAGGLEGFGKPEGYVERQVDRWFSVLDRSRTRELPDVEVVAAWLRAHTPTGGAPGLLHGDYQFANVMFANDLPARVAAVVDWEQSTIGDPLVDLGWMLALWDEPGEDPVRGPEEVRVNQQPGFPTRAELAQRYATRTGRSLDALGWYEVLALFKLACVLEGAYALYAKGESTNPAHARAEHIVPGLLRSAAAIVDRGGDPR